MGKINLLPALERARHDAEPLIAEHARWEVEEIGRRSEKVRGF
jgi:hypothetical protein